MNKPVPGAIFVARNLSSSLGEKFKKSFPNVYEMNSTGRFQREFSLKEVIRESPLGEEGEKRVKELLSETEKDFQETIYELRRKSYKLKNIDLNKLSLQNFQELLQKIEGLSLWNDSRINSYLKNFFKICKEQLLLMEEEKARGYLFSLREFLENNQLHDVRDFLEAPKPKSAFYWKKRLILVFLLLPLFCAIAEFGMGFKTPEKMEMEVTREAPKQPEEKRQLYSMTLNGYLTLMSLMSKYGNSFGEELLEQLLFKSQKNLHTLNQLIQTQKTLPS